MAVQPLPSNNTPINDMGDLSPTTIVLKFLRDHGVTPSGASIRTALEQNAREPGYIPGLGNNAPSTEAEDQAAMHKAGVGGGRRSGSNTPTNTLTADQNNTPVNDLIADQGKGGNQTTSAQPTPAPATAASVAQSVLNPAGRMAVPDIPAPPEAPPTAAVPGVPVSPEAPPMAAAPNPMETAMQRAVGSVPEVPPVPNPVAGVQPVPPEVAGRAAGGPATSVPPEVPGDMQFRRTGSGLQVQPNAMTRALPGAIAGAARGSRAGPLGALAGAAQGAAPDIIPYIMKNLHLN